MTWLPTSSHHRAQDMSNFSPPQPKGFESHQSMLNEDRSNWGLTIELPTPSAPFTLAQSRTPGWDSPWTPRIAGNSVYQTSDLIGHNDDNHDTSARKKRLRTFILTNTYVPLVSLRYTTAFYNSFKPFFSSSDSLISHLQLLLSVSLFEYEQPKCDTA